VTARAEGVSTITATTPDGMAGSGVLGFVLVDPAVAFQKAWVGGLLRGVPVDGVVVLSGLLSDEWTHVGTFPTRREVDRRSISLDNLTLERLYGALTFALTALEFEEARLEVEDPAQPRLGAMRALAGYTYLALAEGFCSGVPLDDPDQALTTAQLFGRAAQRFQDAVGGPIDPTFVHLSRVGHARALLGLGDPVGAGALAAMVPAGFSFATSHTTALGDDNQVFSLNHGRRISVPEVEGGNGLPFRSAMDPRVPWDDGGLSQGGVLPVYRLLKFSGPTADFPVATSTEARLIQAEGDLASGSVGAFLARLNDLRTGAGLPALADPGTSESREDLLFRERAFWLYATGQRLGDLRRLVREYGRDPGTLFPVGAHPLGEGYGTDANLPVPLSARGPSFSGCTDRVR
jgi:starch-binding outer membrane protein, SusD/RagB family